MFQRTGFIITTTILKRCWRSPRPGPGGRPLLVLRPIEWPVFSILIRPFRLAKGGVSALTTARHFSHRDHVFAILTCTLLFLILHCIITGTLYGTYSCCYSILKSWYYQSIFFYLLQESYIQSMWSHVARGIARFVITDSVVCYSGLTPVLAWDLFLSRVGSSNQSLRSTNLTIRRRPPSIFFLLPLERCLLDFIFRVVCRTFTGEKKNASRARGLIYTHTGFTYQSNSILRTSYLLLIGIHISIMFSDNLSH